MEVINNYYKVPFKTDYLYIYDQNNDMVAELADSFYVDSECKYVDSLIKAFNDKEDLSLENVTIDDENLYIDGRYVLTIRGWGHLTNTCGLSHNEAIEVQQHILNYFKSCLEK